MDIAVEVVFDDALGEADEVVGMELDADAEGSDIVGDSTGTELVKARLIVVGKILETTGISGEAAMLTADVVDETIIDAEVVAGVDSVGVVAALIVKIWLPKFPVPPPSLLARLVSISK